MVEVVHASPEKDKNFSDTSASVPFALSLRAPLDPLAPSASRSFRSCFVIFYSLGSIYRSRHNFILLGQCTAAPIAASPLLSSKLVSADPLSLSPLHLLNRATTFSKHLQPSSPSLSLASQRIPPRASPAFLPFERSGGQRT